MSEHAFCISNSWHKLNPDPFVPECVQYIHCWWAIHSAGSINITNLWTAEAEIVFSGMNLLFNWTRCFWRVLPTCSAVDESMQYPQHEILTGASSTHWSNQSPAWPSAIYQDFNIAKPNAKKLAGYSHWLPMSDLKPFLNWGSVLKFWCVSVSEQCNIRKQTWDDCPNSQCVSFGAVSDWREVDRTHHQLLEAGTDK